MVKSKVLAIFTIALFSALVLASPSGAAPVTQTVTILGGVIDETHPLGSQDAYTEASIDNGLTWNPAYLVGQHPWGFVADTNSWLNCGPSLSDCLGQTSLYRYRFFVPANYSSPTLDAAFIVDNLGVITLNGTEISPGQVAANWSTNGPIDISTMLQAGWNELRVTLVDQGGLAGINYRLVISLQAEEEVVVAPPGSEPIQVSYNPLGGSLSRLLDSYNIGDPGFNLPIPEKAGFTFLGWFTQEVGGEQVSETNYTPASSTTLYAHWDSPQVLNLELANTGFSAGALFWLASALVGLGYLLFRVRRFN